MNAFIHDVVDPSAFLNGTVYLLEVEKAWKLLQSANLYRPLHLPNLDKLSLLHKKVRQKTERNVAVACLMLLAIALIADSQVYLDRLKSC